MNVKLTKLNITLIILFFLLLITLLGIIENFLYNLFLQIMNKALAIIVIIMNKVLGHDFY